MSDDPDDGTDGRTDDDTDDDAREDLLDGFRRAERLFAAGRPADAAALLAPVVEAAPESTAALELLARAYFESAQLARAEQSLVALVERRPDYRWSRVALARALERQGRHEEAVVHHRVADALGGASPGPG